MNALECSRHGVWVSCPSYDRQVGEDADPQRAADHGDGPESLGSTQTSDVVGWTGEALACEWAETRPGPTSRSISRLALVTTL